MCGHRVLSDVQHLSNSARSHARWSCGDQQAEHIKTSRLSEGGKSAEGMLCIHISGCKDIKQCKQAESIQLRINVQSFVKLVGLRGFEPPTPCSRSRCATRLRYSPTVEGGIAVERRFCKCETGA